MTTVTADAVGTYTVKCTFSDGVNTAVDSMTITVAKADSYGQIDPETGSTVSAPKIAVSLPATAEINQVISSKIENVNNAQISWYSVIVNDSVVCPVADDGTFSITMPGDAEAVAVSVRAFDWSGNSDQKDFTITVKDMRPTVQITASKASVAVGDPSPYFLAAWTNTDRLAAVNYTLNGAAVALTNGQYVLSTSVAGSYVLSVTAVSTMGDTITASATITVVAPDTTPPVLTASMASTAVYVGDPMDLNIDASDDSGAVTLSVEADSGSIQNTNGTYTYTASEKGTHTITVTAADGAGNKTTVTLSVKAFDKTTDPSSPKVSFSGIADGQVITAPTDITGTVTEAGLNYYVLEYAPAGDTNFTEFARGTQAVDNGVLGTFDPTLLNNGWYTIRICGYGPTAYSEMDITVSVEGQMKIGNFSIAFEDMSVPVDNFPLTISRGYDSRSKNTMGDFGYGWSLGISNVKVSESVTPGENWSQKSSGGGSLATYSIIETRPHTVSIDWGNGQIDKFNMKLTPSSRLMIPIETGISVSYTASSGTTSTLEALGTTTNLIYNAGTLYDLDLNVYNPTEYKLTQADGTVYIISETTGVESITHPDGTVITFDKDGVYHSDGKSILFTRDTQGRITKITGPTGDTVNYTYDAAGNLTDVVDLSGFTTSFTYDTHHYLTAIKDARGITVSRNEYDDNGRLIATVDADGNRTEFTHDIDGRQEVITDRLGHATLYIYDDCGNVLSKTDANNNTTTYTYDANNQMKSKTDALGNTTQYSYDAMGKLLSYTDAAGSVLTNTYSAKGYLTSIAALGVTQLVINYDDAGSITDTKDAAGNTTSYTYDSQSRVTGVTDAIGVYVKFTYDDNGHVATATNGLGLTSTFTYDAKGNCISRSQNKTTDTGVQVVTEHYTYDAAGHLTQVIYADGTVTNTEYNVIGKISAAVDSKGRRTTYEYDLFGNLSKITYCDNTTETFAYDKEGRNTAATDRMGRTVTMVYDAVGNLLSTAYPNQSKISYTYDKVYRLKTATGTNGAVTTYEYDALGRNTAIVDALGNRTEFGYNAASLLISMTDSKGNTYHYEYDANGKRTKTILPDGSASSTVYDARGRVTSVTDQHGYTTAYAYDGLDRLTSVTDAAGKVWKYTYDETGDLTAVTDANGNTTRYAYDLMGRVIKTTNAQNASAAMTYDEAGNIVTATDYAGVLTTYAYDGLDRLSSKTTGTSVVSFTYTIDGLLAAVTDASGVTAYTYDSMNGLTDVKYPDGTYLHYVYDVSGRLTSVQTAYGTTGYTYDLLNRLTSVTDLTGAVTAYTYDANGNRSSMKYANGIATNYTYDSCNRLIQETITDSTGTILESYTITLGAAGERTQIVELHRTVSYEYDSLYRLTKETISAGGLSKDTDYTYDAMGNRLTKTSDGAVTGYTYNSLNQLTGETGITYTYDANGSQTSQDGASKTAAYTYDQQGRLIGAVVTTGGATTTETYQYNWSGIRTSKTTNGVKTKYLIDPNGSLSQVIAELDSAGNLVTYYTRGSELISLHRTGGTGTGGAGTGTGETGTGGTSAAETRYYQYDPNGSVRLLTDGAGAITDTYTYDAFGNLLAQTGTTVNSYLYNGQQYDANTGFYYLRARYMNPSTGTFISMDPAQGSIFDPVSLHKYLYANANPVMNSDPSGRETLGELATAMAIDAIIEGAIGGTLCSIINSLEYVTHGGAFFSQGNLNAINNGLKSGFLLGFGLGILGQVLNIFLFTLIVATIGLYTINYGDERIKEGDYGWGVFYILAGLAGMGLPILNLNDTCFTNEAVAVVGNSAEGGGGGEPVITEGQTVYRIWGGNTETPDNSFSEAWGHSWTTVDPRTIENYRNIAGLPDANTGRFISIGTVTDSTGVTIRKALPLDGNMGGLDEALFPNPNSQIELNGVYGLNPSF
jgi:RHS repeat-associated protein